MAMTYPSTAIPESAIPRAADRSHQHLLDTYASEINKLASVWSVFTPADLDYRPHRRSSTVREILKHELLSARRFFGEFLGAPEPPAGEVLPAQDTPEAYRRRMVELALPRLAWIASRSPEWWLEEVPFFDVRRDRIWIFWRRILHTAHHRTQLAVFARLLEKPVPPAYGPTADVTWSGADPTTSVSAASR
jgi:uncharacterized damage-inducible protein DinB